MGHRGRMKLEGNELGCPVGRVSQDWGPSLAEKRFHGWALCLWGFLAAVLGCIHCCLQLQGPKGSANILCCTAVGLQSLTAA